MYLYIWGCVALTDKKFKTGKLSRMTQKTVQNKISANNLFERANAAVANIVNGAFAPALA